MYVCNCNGITEREIRGAVELGCTTLSDLRRDLGVATCCGKCAPHARKVLRHCTRACAGCPEAFAGGDD
jgi:bacterioferritin-associated ferredoxin